MVLKLYGLLALGAVIDLFIFMDKSGEKHDFLSYVIAAFLGPVYWYIIVKHYLTGGDE